MTVASRIRRFLAGDAGPGPCLALAVIALLAGFLATAGPREITSLQNKALRQTLRRPAASASPPRQTCRTSAARR